MTTLTEADAEAAALSWLASLGCGWRTGRGKAADRRGYVGEQRR